MRIYVGGLSFTSNSAGLLALFSQAGTVTDVNVIEDRDTGQSKGFAFVEMPDDGQARAAITRFNGYSHDERSLKVNEAKPRESGNGTSSGTSRGNQSR